MAPLAKRITTASARSTASSKDSVSAATLDRLQARQQEEQRGAVGHLGLALAAAGDLRIGIGARSGGLTA